MFFVRVNARRPGRRSPPDPTNTVRRPPLRYRRRPQPVQYERSIPPTPDPNTDPIRTDPDPKARWYAPMQPLQVISQRLRLRLIHQEHRILGVRVIHRLTLSSR